MQHPSLHVSQHPLLKHKISILRDKLTPSPVVRNLVKEISLLLSYEAIADLELESAGNLESPMAPYEGVKLKDRIALVPVMRAGSGMLDGLLTMVREIPTTNFKRFQMQRSIISAYLERKQRYNRWNITRNFQKRLMWTCVVCWIQCSRREALELLRLTN
jgi:hypothetical protein